jgi:hypothetical protein
VIKNGKCKVLKKVKFNSEAMDTYKSTLQSTRQLDLKKYELVNSFAKSKIHHKAQQSAAASQPNNVFSRQRFSSTDPKKSSFLELFKLKEGDVYGLQDLILNRSTDNKPSPAMLVSEGAECILINKRYFMECLSPNALIKLRFLITPYPSDDKLVSKYFHSFAWQNFKSDSFTKTLNRVKQEKKYKSASMFNMNSRF